MTPATIERRLSESARPYIASRCNSSKCLVHGWAGMALRSLLNEVARLKSALDDPASPAERYAVGRITARADECGAPHPDRRGNVNGTLRPCWLPRGNHADHENARGERWPA